MLALTSSTETIYHRWRASAKLAAVSVGVFALYLIDSPALLSLAVAGVALAYLVGGWQFLVEGVRFLRPLWFFVAIVLVWHVVAGDPLTGLAVALRLVAAVGLANLVTMTTRLDDLVELVLWILSPLEKLGIRTAPIGYAMALVVRFTPVLFGKAGTLVDSWRARSARRPGWRLVMPITVTAIDDAEQVAEALRARGGFDSDP
ncbi:biotin transport system permease protein [Primorskyibacter sedentarius]|uniref:Biotin transport system permease protein n=2 Tax=Primorskyibacter sedentarius TaxID=745311 RepID=A0A4R3IWC4_9RHOB|nr:energy-coupling factor transporter transmembrane component T [Primorskyibacter sedentarius]TCS53962.1 biotin transport system permease protein [Primorskyibacter sedentarius]